MSDGQIPVLVNLHGVEGAGECAEQRVRMVGKI